MLLWKSSIPIKCWILGMLLVHVDLEVHNVTIQTVSIIDISISIVNQIMGIHIPPWHLASGAISSPLWCKLGIIV